MLVIFGGRNTDGKADASGRLGWGKWCDDNGIFLIAPGLKNDNYWEPDVWSGKALQKAIDEYQNNCPYSLVDENCAAWVNSMLERVGIPKSERDRLGEFFGVDWGEEDLSPSQYFVKE